MFDIDRTIKIFADRYAPAYIRWLQGPAARLVEKLKVELPASTRYADLVYRLWDSELEQSYIFHLEVQAQQSKHPMPFRMLDYDSRLLVTHKLPVCSTVVYLVPEAEAQDPGELRIRCPGDREVLLYHYQVKRLWTMARDELAGLVGLYPLLGLTRLDGPPEQVLRTMVQDIQRIKEPDVRVDTLFGFKTLSALVHPKELLDRLIREEAIMESPVLQELAEKIYQEALVEGRVEGRVEERRASVLDILLARFELSYPTVRQFETRIEQIESLAMLRKLAVEAMRSETLEDFARMLDQLGVKVVPA